jgi:hypothetical protein
VNTPEEFEYYWWTNAARNEIAALITQMGLQGCPVCASNEALGLLPWPGVVHIGGTEKPVGAPHRGNLLFMALVRCESCGYSMMFDSEKLTGKHDPPIWGGPGPPTD